MTYLARILFFMITCFLMAANLQAAPTTPTPSAIAPSIKANAYLLFDYHANKVIAQKNANERVEPASLTKMMTVYVIDKAIKNGSLKLDQAVEISERAWRTEGSRMFVEVGSSVPVSELLKGIIIQSGNDASVALAEYIAGSEEAFAALMNQEAQQLGMKHSHFMNATGLPHKEHYSTARDLSLLANAIIRDFPESYALYAEKWYTYNNIKQPNRNRLLWRDKRVDGIKTGHTSAAGYCLVASAKQGDMRLVSVLLGAKNDSARTDQSAKLLNFGFRFFETHQLYSANDPVSDARIWMGASKTIPVGLAEDFYVSVPKGTYNNLSVQMELTRVIKAPIKKGQVLGSIRVNRGDELVAEKPLIALANIAKGGIWHRFTDYISLKFQRVTAKDDQPEGAPA